MARPYGLTDDEYRAIRQLQDGVPAPPWHCPVWIGPLSASIVWIDRSVDPPAVRLTSDGRTYPSDSMDMVPRRSPST
jgi:hypothetical protein